MIDVLIGCILCVIFCAASTTFCWFCVRDLKKSLDNLRDLMLTDNPMDAMLEEVDKPNVL